MIDASAIESRVAETILQKGVRILVPAPFLLRLIGIKTIPLRLYSPYEGTMHRIAHYYLRTGIKDDQLSDISTEEALALMAVHGKSISKAVAVGILNGYWAGKLFTRPLAWYLRWHLKPHALFALTSALLIYGGTSDFMNTTRSVRMMKLTAPNLAKKDQRR